MDRLIIDGVQGMCFEEFAARSGESAHRTASFSRKWAFLVLHLFPTFVASSKNKMVLLTIFCFLGSESGPLALLRVSGGPFWVGTCVVCVCGVVCVCVCVACDVVCHLCATRKNPPRCLLGAHALGCHLPDGEEFLRTDHSLCENTCKHSEFETNDAVVHGLVS